MKNLFLLALILIFLSSCDKNRTECYTCSVEYQYDTKTELNSTMEFDKNCPVPHQAGTGESHTPLRNPYTGVTALVKNGTHSYRAYHSTKRDSLTQTVTCVLAD